MSRLHSYWMPPDIAQSRLIPQKPKAELVIDLLYAWKVLIGDVPKPSPDEGQYLRFDS